MIKKRSWRAASGGLYAPSKWVDGQRQSQVAPEEVPRE